MSTCKRHPHSSPQSARKCWEKWVGKRGDRALKNLVEMPARYIQVKCEPPELVQTESGIQVLYFFKATKSGFRW